MFLETQSNTIKWETKRKALKLHTKKGIRKHMIKIFIYSNAEICLKFARSFSHFLKDVPTDLSWKLIHALKNFKINIFLFYKSICSIETYSFSKKQFICFQCLNFLVFLSFSGVLSLVHRDAYGFFSISYLICSKCLKIWVFHIWFFDGLQYFNLMVAVLFKNVQASVHTS